MDFEQNFVSINESKFYKSRRVPFNHQVKKLLQEYLKWRKLLSMPEHEEALLFYTKKGEPETANRMRYFFKQVRTLAGIKRTNKSFRQPRIHDLRYPNKNKIQTFDIIHWFPMITFENSSDFIILLSVLY